MNLQLPLSDEPRWLALPSPKIRSRDKAGIHAWTHAYAGFSYDFCLEALKQLGAKGGDVVLDPFIGSGTTAVAASVLGSGVVGVDVDPFSALVTRAKAAVGFDQKAVAKLLVRSKGEVSSSFSPIANDFFSPADLAYAAGVFARIQRKNRDDPDRAWKIMLEDRVGDRDSETVALAAVVLAARARATVARGSNPVWFRRVQKRSGQSASLHELAGQFARKLFDDLRHARDTYRARDVSVRNANFLDGQLSPDSVDLVLTSPPYLSRLDYAVSHLPELALLTGFTPFDIERVRCAMVGTTKMVTKCQPEENWGPTCLTVLKQIEHHSSYASKRYYYRFYCQYFHDLFRSLVELERVCRTAARGILVIQDSYYKDIRIPVVQILLEMAKVPGIGITELRTETKTGHIGSMSPRQRLYAPRKALSESVLLLEF